MTLVITKNNEIIDIDDNPTTAKLNEFVWTDNTGIMYDEDWNEVKAELIELW